MQATQSIDAIAASHASTVVLPAAAALDARPVQAVQPVAGAGAQQQHDDHARQALTEVAEYLQEYLQSSARNLEFKVDTDARQTVIIVRDSRGEVIRQIPNEEAQHLRARLNEGSSTFLDLFA